MICFSKIGFLECIVMVINCTEGMERKAQKIGCGGSCSEVFGCARLDIRRITGCVKGWCPIFSGCWPEVGLRYVLLWYLLYFFVSVVLDGRVFVVIVFC